MDIITNEFWTFYIDKEKEHLLQSHKVGKWMYFFKKSYDLNRIQKLCYVAVDKNIVVEAKHTAFDSIGKNPNGNEDTGVCCFYLLIDDIEGHKKILEYFLHNNMIARTKANKLWNISFKLDTQTHFNEYGSLFTGKVNLSTFVDLDTGEWIYNNKN